MTVRADVTVGPAKGDKQVAKDAANRKGDKEKDKEEQPPPQQQPEVKRLEKLHPAQKSSAAGSRPRSSTKKGSSSSSSKAKEGDKESVAKLFGSGPEQVQYEKDKEQGIWKVSPPTNQRFTPSFLHGLSKFVGQQLSKQRAQQRVARAAAKAAGDKPAAAASGSGSGAAAAPTPSSCAAPAKRSGGSSRGRTPRGPSTSAAAPASQPSSTPKETPKAGEVFDQQQRSPTKVQFAQEGSPDGEGDSSSQEEQLLSDEPSELALAGEEDSSSDEEEQEGEEEEEGEGEEAAGGSGSGAGGSRAAQQGEGGEQGVGSPVRAWWPEGKAGQGPPKKSALKPSGGVTPRPTPKGANVVQLSLRLERQGLTDRDARMLADWASRAGPSVSIRKLVLFDNELGDEGAKHVARMMSADLLEVQLSHNRITAEGAAALLRAVPVGDVRSKPLKMRLEWNRVSPARLVKVLEAEHAERGLIVDLPQPAHLEGPHALPFALPAYLLALAAEHGVGAEVPLTARGEGGPSSLTNTPRRRGGSGSGSSAGGAGSSSSRGSASKTTEGKAAAAAKVQRCLVPRAHARLPWLSCQYQMPGEAAVLQAARHAWAAAAAAGGGGAAGAATAGRRGPLVVFLDLGATLSCIGAHPSVAPKTGVTLSALSELAGGGKFGTAVDPSEQVHIVVPDTAARQMEGLKNHPLARTAVKQFLAQGLDAYGPAGLDFLTVLGGHEGEGLIAEHRAAAQQKLDPKIVEVALYFQQQVLQAASGGAGTGLEGEGEESLPVEVPSAFPVVLVSTDQAQVGLARSHGLPALRLQELAPLDRWMQQVPAPSVPLTASVFRDMLGATATTGLGSTAARSIHAEFDGVVACLRATANALQAAQASLAEVGRIVEDPHMAPIAALTAVRELLPPAPPSRQRGGEGGEGGPGGMRQHGVADVADFVAAVQRRLGDWEGMVQSHQSPRKVLRYL